MAPKDQDFRFVIHPDSVAGVPVATFRDLIGEWQRRATEGELEPLTANGRTVLGRFMRMHGLEDASPITPSLTVEFRRRLVAFEAAARTGTEWAAALRPSSLPGYVSRLRAWHRLALDMVAVSGFPDGFNVRLDAAIADHLARNPDDDGWALARRVGMDGAVLARWRRRPIRPHPNQKTLDRIRSLEAELDLEPDYLLSEVHWNPSRKKPSNRADLRAKEVARRPKKWGRYLNDIPFRPSRAKLEMELPAIEGFLVKLREYKTSLLPGDNLGHVPLKRPRASRWRVLGDKCVADNIFRAWFSGMIGWMLLPATLDGARRHVQDKFRHSTSRLEEEEIETLAPLFVGLGMHPSQLTPIHLVEPRLVSQYLTWCTKRSGAESGYHRALLGHVAGLIRPRLGFLAQQVEFAWDYLGWAPPDMGTANGREEYRRQFAEWASICGKRQPSPTG